MKVIINPAYKQFNRFLNNIPVLFEQGTTTIYKGRNELKLIETSELQVVVKSFRKPFWFNRIIYTFFRSPKAKRSYNYAFRLHEKGINTPIPIAYIIEKKNGLLSSSYYISSHSNYPGLLRDLDYCQLEDVIDLVEAFAHFTASMHEKLVLHLDYSPGNILYEKKDDQYNFCLVDLNRMKFGKVSLNAGCHCFRRLWANDEIITHMAKIYAHDRGFDETKCIDLSLKYFRKFWEAREKKKQKVKNLGILYRIYRNLNT